QQEDHLHVQHGKEYTRHGRARDTHGPAHDVAQCVGLPQLLAGHDDGHDRPSGRFAHRSGHPAHHCRQDQPGRGRGPEREAEHDGQLDQVVDSHSHGLTYLAQQRTAHQGEDGAGGSAYAKDQAEHQGAVFDQDEGDQGHWQHLGAEIVEPSAAEEQPEPSIPEGLGKVEHVVISGCGELPQAAGWQSMSEPRVRGSSLIPETDHPASASKPVNSPRVRSRPPTATNILTSAAAPGGKSAGASDSTYSPMTSRRTPESRRRATRAPDSWSVRLCRMLMSMAVSAFGSAPDR